MKLPEDALVLVTVMDESAIDSLTLGEQLATGLQDVLFGRVTEVKNVQEMKSHLDKLLE